MRRLMHSGGLQTAVAALVMTSVAVAHSLIHRLSEARKRQSIPTALSCAAVSRK